ncbi:MAG: radical SAM protein [Cyanobacteria bacterium SIG29]|nr:radical SAM protein [Cyanobacteria bacterium SIG29]
MRYKSCRLLEHGIYFYLDPGSKQLCVGHCCNTDNLELPDRLYLYSDLKNQTLSWDYIFEEKRKLRENAKKGIYPSQCDGCFELVERDWDDDDYINHLTAGHIMKCNSRCVYCPIGRIPDCHNREQDVDMKPIVEELLEKNLLRYDGSLRFVGGEPTLMKEFDWLVDLFSKNNVPEIYVPTSGIRLSKSLCKALEKVPAAAIVASVDSGTKETFEKVKGTKFFDIVQKNMATYLKHAKEKNFVISKFILFANYNDSAFEIEAWLENCHKQGYVEVQFDSEHSVSSSEHCENKKYVNRTLRMLDYTERFAEKYNIKVTSYLAFMNRAKKIYEQQVACIDKFKYSNINFEDFVENKIDELVRNEEFSPKRRVKMTISKPVLDNEADKLKTILRLGFDFDIEIKNYISSPILDEIVKTSYSNIVYLKGKNNLLNLFKINRLKNKYKKMIKLSKIEF